MKWLTWSWIPGVHWLGWLHAGLLAREPMYAVFSLVYALPTILLLMGRPLSLRFLLVSWVVCLIHTLIQKPFVDRRIAQVRDQVGGRQKLMQALLHAALKHGGCLTVTQGVMATNATFAEVEQALQAMMAAGYVYMRDNVDTGVIEYVFTEMQSE